MSYAIETLWTCDRCGEKERINPMPAMHKRYPKQSGVHIMVDYLAEAMPDGWGVVSQPHVSATYVLCAPCLEAVNMVLRLKPNAPKDWSKP